MSHLLSVRGGRRLEGEVTIQGAKNSVLPILAATLLARGQVALLGCPRLRDVDASIRILRHLGCDAHWEADALAVDTTALRRCEISDVLMREMRSSAIFLGAILARIALLICGSVEKFCCQWESFSIDAFMANAFLIVMGIEFVKMLMLHTYGAVIDVLLFAIARQMIISHEEPMQTLMSVGAVAGIFAIKKYLYTGERWESGQKDRPCSK